jgi:hypothetical protein
MCSLYEQISIKGEITMGLFGPPNVKKMIAKHDVRGLINVLLNQEDTELRKEAALGLSSLGDPQAIPPLITVLRDKASDKILRSTAAIALSQFDQSIVREYY